MAKKQKKDGWIQLADGVKYRIRKPEDLISEIPLASKMMPINHFTDLNGCRPDFLQLDAIQKHFGHMPTIREIENFLIQKNALTKVTLWDTVVLLMQQTTPPQADRDELPKDLMTLNVVVADYRISRAQLKRDINESGKLISYRKKDAPKNSPHKVSRKDIARLYEKKMTLPYHK